MGTILQGKQQTVWKKTARELHVSIQRWEGPALLKSFNEEERMGHMFIILGRERGKDAVRKVGK
jgi:hypothetical protein